MTPTGARRRSCHHSRGAFFDKRCRSQFHWSPDACRSVLRLVDQHDALRSLPPSPHHVRGERIHVEATDADREGQMVWESPAIVA
jgi:hypothetical protein